MKRWLSFTLCLGMLCGGQLMAQNLLRNGSFELQQERKEIPEEWATLNNVPKTTLQRQEKIIVKDGQTAVYTENRDPGSSRGITHWIQRDLKQALDPLPEGTPMELSVYAYPLETACAVHLFFESPTSQSSSAENYFRGLKPGTWHKLKIEFPLKKGDFSVSHVCLQLFGNGAIVFDCAYLGEKGKNPYDTAGAKSPVELAAEEYCRLLDQTAGSRFPADHFPCKATLEGFLPQPELEVTLSEIDGPIIRQWKFDSIATRKPTEVTIDIPALPENAYELKYVSGDLIDYDWFRVGQPPARGGWIDDTGFPVVDGHRFFPICISVPPEGLADALRVYRQSGMNMIFSQLPLFEETYEYMSELAAKFDIYWFCWNSWGFSQKGPDYLRKTFQDQHTWLQKHDHLMGFLSDEAMWNGIPLDSMRLSYKYMMRYLPEYICYLNHAPRLTGAAGEDRHSSDSGRRYTRAADLSSVDIYPFPEGHGHNNLSNRTLSCVGEYADICRSFTWNTRPVWMIIQAGGWSEEGGKPLTHALPRPGKKEMRFMAWNAITHGAKGIVWYGRGCRDVYSEWWIQLAEVSQELSAMGKLLLDSPIEYLKDLPPQVSGICGNGYRVYVNECSMPVTVDGQELGPQDVRIVTDKPLDLPAVSRFSPQPVQLSKDYGFQNVKNLDASWVCPESYRFGPPRRFLARQTFTLEKLPIAARLKISVDDEAEVSVNGQNVAKGIDSYRLILAIDITKQLKVGENVLDISVFNSGGPTGVVFEVEGDGQPLADSGEATQFSLDGGTSFQAPFLIAPHGKGTWGAPVMLKVVK